MKILVEQGNFGTDDYKILVNGIKIKSVPLLINWKYEILKMVTPFIEDDKLFIELDNHKKYTGLYPAVGIKIVNSNIIDDKMVVNNCELICISLCDKNNSDIDIPFIPL